MRAFILGAIFILSLIVYFVFFDHYSNPIREKKEELPRNSKEMIETPGSLTDEEKIIESNAPEKQKKQLEREKKEPSVISKEEQLIANILYKLDYKKYFENDNIDSLKRDENENAIYSLFNEHTALDLNIGLKSVECKSESCRVEVYSLNGYASDFKKIEVSDFLNSNDKMRGKNVTILKPDENGIRVIYIIPSIENELNSFG